MDTVDFKKKPCKIVSNLMSKRYLEVFIGELLSVDAFSACSVVVREVASLAHEFGDNSVERTTFVAEAFLT